VNSAAVDRNRLVRPLAPVEPAGDRTLRRPHIARGLVCVRGGSA
jgi:hypothetical protein